MQQLQKKGTQLRFICAEDVFDVLLANHRTIGHGGRTGMCKATREKYANISRAQITFLQLCEECQLKKSSVRKSVIVKPIVSNSMNSRAQVSNQTNKRKYKSYILVKIHSIFALFIIFFCSVSL